MNTLDKKIEILSKSAKSTTTICRILIGCSITISLIIAVVLAIQLLGIETFDLETLAISLISAFLGLLIGSAISHFFRL